MSGHSSSHSSLKWNEISLTSICTVLNNSQEKKTKQNPPTLLMLWEPVWLLLEWNGCMASHCYSVVASLFFTYWIIPMCFFLRSLKSRVKIMVDGTLLISRLIPEDSGNYTCMPTNGLLTPPTASATLTVMRTFLCVVYSCQSSEDIKYLFSFLFLQDF